MNPKQKILARCNSQGAQITALRERVLDLVLSQSGVIKAYTVLSLMQEQSDSPVAPPTAYRALDFWVEQGILHKVTAVNGYVLCSHVQHECGSSCQHSDSRPHSAFILVCTKCGSVDEQSLSREWQALQQGVASCGFAIQEEHVVLTGICKPCQK